METLELTCMWKQFNKPTDISAVLLSKWLCGVAEVIDGPGWFQQAGVSDLLTPRLRKTTDSTQQNASPPTTSPQNPTTSYTLFRTASFQKPFLSSARRTFLTFCRFYGRENLQRNIRRKKNHEGDSEKPSKVHAWLWDQQLWCCL